MKTNFLLRNKSTRTNSIQKKILLVIIVFVLFLVGFSVLSFSLAPVFKPVWQAEQFLKNSIGSVVDGFRIRKNLEAENNLLREEIESLKLERLSYAGRAEREKELLLALGRGEKWGGILSAVLVRPPRSYYDMLILDAGESQGVREGNAVYLPEGPEIGFISEVYRSSSRVKLFSASSERTQGILERGDVAIELVGLGGGMFRIILPRETEVVAGDRIWKAGIERTLLAQVRDVNMRSTDSFKEALAVSPTNIFNLKEVIIKPDNE